MFIKNGFLLVLFILISSFFPYLTFYSFGTDIQPFAVVFASILSFLVVLSRSKLNQIFLLLIIPFLFSIILLFFSKNFFEGIRSIIGYTTIVSIPIAFYYILHYYYDYFVKTLKIATIIYFIVGLIQIVLYKGFFHSFLNRSELSSIRGVTSLTVEPTYYGILCIFLILIFLTLNIRKRNFYIGLLLFQIVLLAQSSLAILFVGIYIFYYFIFNLKFKTLLFGLIIIIVCIVLLNNIDFQNSSIRIIKILYNIQNNSKNIFQLDASFNDRLSAIYFSFKGFLDNYFMPHGFGAYSRYLEIEVPRQEFFWWVSIQDRIMCYYGSILFELGIVGLLLPIGYSLTIYNTYKNDRKKMLTNLFFLNTILFMAIPLSYPIIGIYIACLIFYKNNVDCGF